MVRLGLTRACRDLDLVLSSDQLDRIEAFESALYAANETMNLTRVPREEFWIRHVLDSLLIHNLVPLGASVLDIGTGPGFPAWPLACARPDLAVTALDSSGKMLGFLDKMPLPNLSTALGRAEETGWKERFDIVTGRAVAPLPLQLELSSRACKIGGAVIPMRTPNDRSAAESFIGSGLGLQLERIQRVALPGTEIVRLLPVFRKVATTQRGFPRTWAEMRRSPLN